MTRTVFSFYQRPGLASIGLTRSRENFTYVFMPRGVIKFVTLLGRMHFDDCSFSTGSSHQLRVWRVIARAFIYILSALTLLLCFYHVRVWERSLFFTHLMVRNLSSPKCAHAISRLGGGNALILFGEIIVSRHAIAIKDYGANRIRRHNHLEELVLLGRSSARALLGPIYRFFPCKVKWLWSSIVQ